MAPASFAIAIVDRARSPNTTFAPNQVRQPLRAHQPGPYLRRELLPQFSSATNTSTCRFVPMYVQRPAEKSEQPRK
jgi:hypothetical protein